MKNKKLPKSTHDLFKEWSIPAQDLKFDEVVASGHFGDVCRGRWHGEVLIYTFPEFVDKSDLESFKKEVASLSLVRHENIQLFMGAVLTPIPCIVTSMRKGPSLYEELHVRKLTLSNNYRLDIARQVAQALGYLHAKNMTAKFRLNSQNVILESKVKLCLMDQRVQQLGFRCNKDEISEESREELCYLSPEMMRSLEVDSGSIICRREGKKEDDIYSFGTILFELSANRFPFEKHSIQEMIWKVGTGELDTSVHKLTTAHVLKSLTIQCWNPEPLLRPNFCKILRFLNQDSNNNHNLTQALSRKFSCSEPEKLNCTGLALGFCLNKIINLRS